MGDASFMMPLAEFREVVGDRITPGAYEWRGTVCVVGYAMYNGVYACDGNTFPVVANNVALVPADAVDEAYTACCVRITLPEGARFTEFTDYSFRLANTRVYLKDPMDDFECMERQDLLYECRRMKHEITALRHMRREDEEEI